MLVAVSALSVTTAVAAGLAAAGLTAAIGARFRLGAPRILFGASCVAVLICFAVADLTVSGLGRWWAARPIAAAAFTGLLLLSVTVLVVETLIETLDARRLAPAARAAVRDFLDGADDGSTLAQVGQLIASARRTGEPPGLWIAGDGRLPFAAYAIGALRDDAARAEDELRAKAAAHAPVLTAVESLTAFHDRALNVADGVRVLRGYLSAYVGVVEIEAQADRVDRDNHDWRPELPVVAKVWQQVLDAWGRVAANLTDLEQAAAETFDRWVRPRRAWHVLEPARPAPEE